VQYEEAGAAMRRRIHGELAAVALDAEERARHLALSRDPPDSAVARALDKAARLAHDRGAPQAAAELSDQARRFTAAGRRADLRRRLLDCAEYWLEAGDTVRARLVAEEGLASSLAGQERAEALNLLGQVRLYDDVAAASQHFREAASEPEARPLDRAKAELLLATSLLTRHEASLAAAAHAETAVRLAEDLDSPPVLVQALAAKSLLDGRLGRPNAFRAMERALALEHSALTLRVLRQPSYLAGMMLPSLDRLDEARSKLGVAWERARDRGDESAFAWIAHHLNLAERLAGNWLEAADWTRRGYEAAMQSGQEGVRAVLLSDRAMLDALLGKSEAARVTAETALALGARSGQGTARYYGRYALGLLELSLGRPAEAHGHFARLVEAQVAAGFGDPGAQRYLPDEIEALVALGELEEAERLLAPFEERAAALDRASGRAASRRCRGLLQAAQGDQETALQCLEEALEQHDRVSQPYERARSLLVQGVLQRRIRQRREARLTLEEALALFERLGATLWAERARTELRRIGGRQRGASELTPTEEHVAALVAAGQTNREAAAALFLSVRTVEWNLAKIYRKLGLRSRTELAGRLPDLDAPAARRTAG
jgi:DNA-binding CsgD family transcriptional regulator